jgi:hypothetical protein
MALHSLPPTSHFMAGHTNGHFRFESRPVRQRTALKRWYYWIKLNNETFGPNAGPNTGVRLRRINMEDYGGP